jgi:peroxiredoxin
MICQAHLVQVQKAYDNIRSAGGSVLAVTPSRPEVLAAHSRTKCWPFPIVGDPERHAYQAFGLDRTPLWRFLHPKAIFHYLGLMLRGWLPRMPKKGEDVFQLGGDFLIDRRLHLRYAYRSADPADRPSVRALIDAVRRVRRVE